MSDITVEELHIQIHKYSDAAAVFFFNTDEREFFNIIRTFDEEFCNITSHWLDDVHGCLRNDDWVERYKKFIDKFGEEVMAIMSMNRL